MVTTNREFELRGIHHLALVCKDMKATVDFYSGVLGMPLVKTIELPQNLGQHFFFDVGNGDCLAFFWYPEVHDAVPGVSAPASFPIIGDPRSAVGSMNHVAFTVPEERFDEYVEKLKAKGIETSDISNHDDSEHQVSRRVKEGTFLRSIYFFDPDGTLLEFACWTKPFTDADVAVEPRSDVVTFSGTAAAP